MIRDKYWLGEKEVLSLPKYYEKNSNSMKKIVSIIGLCGLLASLLLFPACKEKRGELKKIWYNGSYNRDFNDLNPVHLAEAQ